MIVRILGEGQYDVPDDAIGELNQLDGELEGAIEQGDEAGFRAGLGALLDKVRALGASVPLDALVPSVSVLPSGDATLHEVRDLLSDDGLIPG